MKGLLTYQAKIVIMVRHPEKSKPGESQGRKAMGLKWQHHDCQAADQGKTDESRRRKAMGLKSARVTRPACKLRATKKLPSERWK
jgi:hypothetical protein